MTSYTLIFRHITATFMRPVGYYLKMTSRSYNIEDFLKMTANQRKNRAFVIFGMAAASDKRITLMKHVHNCLCTVHTANIPYGNNLMAKSFYKTGFANHAVCVKYDDMGNGVIDDPGRQIFYAVDVVHFLSCLAWIYGVYEFSVIKN